jgi:hypothetical protein
MGLSFDDVQDGEQGAGEVLFDAIGISLIRVMPIGL